MTRLFRHQSTPRALRVRTAKLAVILTLPLMSVCSLAAGPARYTIETIGPQGQKEVMPLAVSPGGRITGSWYSAKESDKAPFTYIDGKFKKLRPDAPAAGRGINDAGVIIGWSPGPDSRNDFYEDSSGRHVIKEHGFTAADINDAGQVVGGHYEANGRLTGAIYSIADGSFEFIPGTGREAAWPTSINNAGMAAGNVGDRRNSRCFAYQSGVMTDMGTLGGSTCYAADINDHGEIVGESRDLKGHPRAFLWKDGQMFDLLPNKGKNWATGINNRHQIIGVWSANGYEPFFYENGEAVAVTDLLSPEDAKRIDSIYELTGISDAGEIVGWGSMDGGLWSMFVMKPIAGVKRP